MISKKKKKPTQGIRFICTNLTGADLWHNFSGCKNEGNSVFSLVLVDFPSHPEERKAPSREGLRS